MSILIFVEAENGKIKKSSHEAVAYGAKLSEMQGGEVTALAVGDVDSTDLEALGNFGAAKVLHASDARFNDGNIQATAKAVAQAAEQEGASIVVASRSSLVDAIASRVAIKIGATAATNIVALPNTENGFTVKRSIFTGKAFAEVAVPGEKKVLTLAKNAILPEQGDQAATVKAFEVALDDADTAVKRTKVDKVEGDILLPEADKVVSGGRGLKGPENWQMVENLAKTLQAATACSKPVSDMEWRPHHEHVGQTGIKIAPTLYIAAGISGAIQHLAGVNSSKVIVVVNKDPEAPFFKAADYGVVGDAFEVLPKLEEAFKKVL